MRLLGFAILGLVVIVVLAYNLIQNGTLNVPVIYDPLTLKGFVGGEKLAFLRDPTVQSILKKRYKIELDVVKAGSLEMVKNTPADADFLWPAGDLPLEIFKGQNGPFVEEETIFSSPIVIYSWESVVGALEQRGIAEISDKGYYTIELTLLASVISDGASWKDLGLPWLYGKVKVTSTDPTKSNSGNMLAGLFASALSGGSALDKTSIGLLIPNIKSLFSNAGYLPSNSDDVFTQYLRHGPGAYPLAVGYENQILESRAANKALSPSQKDKARILYPAPTVWSSHPLIVVNDKAKRLLIALNDPEIQRIAWMKHGFRTNQGLGKDDAAALRDIGVAETVDQVIPLPEKAVMERIIDVLSE